jgi:hypothetical protein
MRLMQQLNALARRSPAAWYGAAVLVTLLSPKLLAFIGKDWRPTRPTGRRPPQRQRPKRARSQR